MKITKITYIICLHLCFSGFSQTKGKVFYGLISDDLGPLPNVHVINKVSKQATYSNEKGLFRIFANVNDSITFTSIGYKNLVKSLKPEDFGIKENQIHLEKEIIELDEVELKKNLLGSLSSDIKFVKNEELINAETLKLPNAGRKLPTPAERKLITARGGIPLSLGLSNIVSLDYIINSLSGRIDKLEKLRRFESAEKEFKYLKNSFSNYIITDLKIKEENLARFISFCQNDDDYARNKALGEFNLIEFLKQKSITFKN